MPAISSTPNHRKTALPFKSKSSKPSASVLKVLRLFQRHKEGKQKSPWLKVKLSPKGYTQLLEALGKDEYESLGGYVEDKLR